MFGENHFDEGAGPAPSFPEIEFLVIKNHHYVTVILIPLNPIPYYSGSGYKLSQLNENHKQSLCVIVLSCCCLWRSQTYNQKSTDPVLPLS